jgi:hypothetical protein
MGNVNETLMEALEGWRLQREQPDLQSGFGE